MKRKGKLQDIIAVSVFSILVLSVIGLKLLLLDMIVEALEKSIFL